MTAYEEMSSLVNYIQPTKFISFEFSARMYVSTGWSGREGRLGSLHVCMLVQGGWGERAGWVQEQAVLVQEWLCEWNERKGPAPSCTKRLIYKYPA